MSNAIEHSEHVAKLIREGKLRKPEGWIEDPEERRRVIEELRGSMPDLPTAEEFIRRRREL